MTLRLFVIAVILLFLTGNGPASAAFSVYYYQDGRPVDNMADVQALMNETAPVATETSDTLAVTTSNTNAGHFISDQTAVPLAVQDNFAVFATGQFYIASTGDYTFNTFSDDGFSFNIDGSFASSYVNPRAPSDTTTKNIYLTQGYHTLDLLYYEQRGQAVLELSYAKGNFNNFNPGRFDLLVSSAPEPSQWALIAAGFVMTAFRLKQLRRLAYGALKFQPAF